jgi:tRNA-intron lyase
MDPAAAQAKPKHKKKRRRNNVRVSHIQLFQQLRESKLRGVLLDAAVWVCVGDGMVHTLDCLCLGNLDGGGGTAAHVASLLGQDSALGMGGVGNDADGTSGLTKAVRLSPEEAFFMAYGVECLDVFEVSTGVERKGVVLLELAQLWCRLQQVKSDFLVQYLGYHHFRSKGWVPRTGLQYGADFVLYQRHPALAHSDYSVIVLPVNGPLARPNLSWHDLQITNRLTAQVGKRLLLLYMYDRNGSAGYSSPDCLSNFFALERVVRRWVPESQRPIK